MPHLPHLLAGQNNNSFFRATRYYRSDQIGWADHCSSTTGTRTTYSNTVVLRSQLHPVHNIRTIPVHHPLTMEKTSTGILAASVTTGAALLIAGKMFGRKKNPMDDQVPDFLKDEEHKAVVAVLQEKLDYLSGDSLVKIVRQLDFWVNEGLPEAELVDLAKRLVHAATWQSRMGSFQVPKVRFGRTEIQMPIVTCGSMRFQHTWMPDFVPIVINKKKVVETPSQVNLLEVVRQCLKMGINHFETARMYGTSEVQLMHALTTLIQQGEIKRSDFILQTKLPVGPKAAWEKSFQQSWEVFEPLGYIDLLSFWCVSKDEQVEMCLAEGEDSIMATTLEWKKEGKIKHIGFSTHGSAGNIMKMIESNKFDYVNLHYHYFGSYHAEGTPDGKGGHGNLACVEKALELDMGVFNISPIDKGGRLYQPSSQVARTIGPQMTPIVFANLYSWITAGMHTVSVGFARPEDLTETLEAAELFTKRKEILPVLQGATDRLNKLARKQLGEKWYAEGLLKIPSPLEREANGIGLGHALWCHNMLHAFGMYDTAKSRYKNLLSEGKKWNKKKSYEENMKKIGGGNPMRAPDDSIDLDKVLSGHYDSKLAAKRVTEIHQLLGTLDKGLDKAERKKRGWDEAYDLRPWNEFPDTENASLSTVVLANLTRGILGNGGGPTKQSIDLGAHLREVVAGQV